MAFENPLIEPLATFLNGGVSGGNSDCKACGTGGNNVCSGTGSGKNNVCDNTGTGDGGNTCDSTGP